MEDSRSAAERIRPILQAMERSIENVRRRRLNASEKAVGPRRVDPERPSAQQKEQAHRKARPKRPSALIRPYNAAADRPEVVRPPTP